MKRDSGAPKISQATADTWVLAASGGLGCFQWSFGEVFQVVSDGWGFQWAGRSS